VHAVGVLLRGFKTLSLLRNDVQELGAAKLAQGAEGGQKLVEIVPIQGPM